jgi:hypothetical protein
MIRKIITITMLLLYCSVSQTLAISSQDQQNLDDSNLYYWGNQTQTTTCTSGTGVSVSVPAGTLPTIIPEPYNGAFTEAANKYNVAPALIAALFTEEHFTGTATSQIAIDWAQFIKEQTNPNSGWAVGGSDGATWPDGSTGAEGPFQFEPDTWKTLGVDGDGDGVKDPNDLLDAAFAAANYAQTDGATINASTATISAFILSYNHSQSYVAAVLQYYAYYNSGGTPATGGGSTTITSTPSSCGSDTAVNCSANPSTTTGTSTGATAIRQDVVCIAEGELAKWQSGQITPAQGYLTYSQGWYEEWCADFASWVYDQASYPLQPDPNWQLAGVAEIQDVGQQNQRFQWHNLTDPSAADYDPSYVPQPGDLAIHSGAHVNIVDNVQGTTVKLIGGDQTNPADGDDTVFGADSPTRTAPSPASTSLVSVEMAYGFTDDGITGYVSPN